MAFFRTAIVLRTAALCIATALGSAAAAEEPTYESHQQAMDAALASLQEERQHAAKRLAGGLRPDPWVIIEFLCARGHFDEAAAFAMLGPETAREARAEYVRTKREHPPTKDDVAAMLAAERLIDAVIQGDRDAQVPLPEGAPEATVTSLRTRLLAAAFLLHRGDASGALALAAPAATMAEALGSQTLVVALQSEVARAHGHRDARASVEAARAAYQAATTLGLPHGSGRVLQLLAWAEINAGNEQEGVSLLLRCLDRVEAKDSPDLARVGNIALNLSRAYRTSGRPSLALMWGQRAIQSWEAVGHQGQVAAALNIAASAARRVGDYALALGYAERARDIHKKRNRPGEARHSTAAVASIYAAMGAFDDATRLLTRGVRDARASKDRQYLAVVLLSLARIQTRAGRYEEAVENAEEALQIEQQRKHRRGEAMSRTCLAKALHALDRSADAKAHLMEAIRIDEQRGNRTGIAIATSALGHVLLALGEPRAARQVFDTALDAARDSHPPSEISARTGLVGLSVKEGDLEEATRHVGTALSLVDGLASRLTSTESAGVRESYAPLFAVARSVALRSDDASLVARILERARAASLRAVLGTSNSITHAAISPELRRMDLDARKRAHRALMAYSKVRGGSRSASRAARKVLRQAEADVARVAKRVLRAAGRSTVSLRRPAEMEVVQEALRADEVLVTYFEADASLHALVVTRRTALLRKLGAVQAIRTAASALLAGMADKTSVESVARARAHLIDPLQLPEESRRVVLCPGGTVADVPFSVLLPNRDLAVVPSATTLVMQRARNREAGRRVLAVGDPAYDAAVINLPRLPATRAEVEAVGDVKLLGPDATRTGVISALADATRWKSVHFACHGLLNTKQPLLSALALTPTAKDDGRLAAADVLRLHVPADLVVLSACDSGGGRVYRTEGLVGLSQSFLVAGATQVLCSLRKVDDEATMALMTAFYKHWTRDERTRRDVASALRLAQADVRANPRWVDPFFWAPWVVVGVAPKR